MPSSVIIAAVSAAVAVATGTSIVAAAITFVASVALSGVSRALQKKPKTPDVGSASFDSRERTLTVRQPVAPWRVVYGRARVGGVFVFLGTTPQGANANGFLHAVIVLAGHEVEEIGSIYFDDYEIPLTFSGNGWRASSGKYVNDAGESYVYFEKYLGTANQTASGWLVSRGIGWTDAHRLRGRAYIYAQIQWDADKFPNGLPNITAIVKGKKVYDPRTGQTAWSDNPALCVADYLTDESYGRGADYATEINEDLLIEAANICDETVTLKGGGTEKRYTCNGTFTTDARPKQIIEEMLSSMAGDAVWTGGVWDIYAGAYRTPTIELDEDDLRGGFRVRSLIPKRENFNAIKGTFISPSNLWQPDDFPAITSSVFEEQDGGERKFKDIQLPYTISATMAQRLAKIDLLRARQSVSTVWPCKLTAYRLKPPQTAMLTNARMGWDRKVFEVAAMDLVEDRNGYLGCDVAFRETDPSIYEWSTDEEQDYDPAPNTNLPDPFTVGAPSNLTAESGSDHLLGMSDGSVISRIFVSWDDVPNAFVREYHVQFKKSSEGTWTDAPVARGNSVYVQPVEDGRSYDVRVRAINDFGVRGAWTTLTGHTVVGKTEAPPAPDTFTVERLADGTRRYIWALNDTPADVRSGGGFRIRYLAGSTSDWDAMTPLHTGLLTSSPYESNELAAGTYTFAIKAVDSSGNESDTAKFVTATIGDPRLRNVLLSRSEHVLGFPGTLTDCYLDTDTTLRPGPASGSPQSDWASLSGRTWASLAGSTWATITPRVESFTYRTPIIDLEANVSFTPLLSAVTDGSVTYRMATGEDGQSPTVDSFGPLGTVTAKRYIQFEVTVSGGSLSQLTIIIDGDTQIDEFADVDVATASAFWFEKLATGHFRIGTKSGNISAITMAQITAIQNAGGAATWELISKTASIGSPGILAAEFKTRNSAGVLTDYVVDVELKGPKIQ